MVKPFSVGLNEQINKIAAATLVDIAPNRRIVYEVFFKRVVFPVVVPIGLHQAAYGLQSWKRRDLACYAT